MLMMSVPVQWAVALRSVRRLDSLLLLLIVSVVAMIGLLVTVVVLVL